MELYVDSAGLAYQKKRYIKAIEEFENNFMSREISIFSAPGRSEIVGNHTDHQRGKVLATSVNLDAIAIVSKIEDDVVQVV